MYLDILTKEATDLLEEYEKKFGEMLPLMQWDGTHEELLVLLRECLASGKPYESDNSPDILY